jgi:pyruvate dehydrogenase E1 component alpha subunit
MGTALSRHQSQVDIRRKADAYGLPADAADGMDVLAVESAARRAADHVRRGDGPFLLELRTYRFRAHSMADPELYRTKREVEEWKARDPIALFVARLRDSGLVAEFEMAAIEGGVAALVDEAVRFAEAGPWEPVEDLTRHVYAPVAP